MRNSVRNEAQVPLVDEPKNDSCSEHLTRGKFSIGGALVRRYLGSGKKMNLIIGEGIYRNQQSLGHKGDYLILAKRQCRR